MVRKKIAEKPNSRVLDTAGLRRAITLLERRIGDLESFDISSIEKRWSAQTEALETKVNDSLAEIFGRDTAEYEIHYIDTFDTGDLVMTIEWFADGAGWQGGVDESWAIDNLEIILNE